jgi:hypothetical protein
MLASQTELADISIGSRDNCLPLHEISEMASEPEF